MGHARVSEVGCPNDGWSGDHCRRGPWRLPARSIPAPGTVFRSHRLMNDEGHLPYQRPPLSKAYHEGNRPGPESLMFRPEKFYPGPEDRADLRPRGVDRPRGAQGASLASGSSLDYGHLVLATGARNRLLDIPNANLDRRALFADARRKPVPARLSSRRSSASW